jgi:hypothetical protein
LYNAFIYAPNLSAFGAGDPLVDTAGSLLAETLPNTYYERCWALIGESPVEWKNAAALVGAWMKNFAAIA